MSAVGDPGRPMAAWVVFSGRADLGWLRLLKPGFRHCFLVLHDGRHWVTLDPLAGRTAITVRGADEIESLPVRYAAQGLTVVAARVEPAPARPAPLAPFTCVEAVKRVLGLHRRRIVTPFQLYRHLARASASAGAAAAA